MNALIYPALVVLGFVMGYVVCMRDVSRNIQDLKNGKTRYDVDGTNQRMRKILGKEDTK